MEYVFGTKKELEVLKTKGSSHSDLTGYHQIEQIYPDQTVTDHFRIVRKLESQEDGEGNCYDWYEIDHHYRTVDRTKPIEQQVNAVNETTSIAFVTMAEKGDIDDTTAGEHPDVFAEWAYPVAYKTGNIRRYGEKLYRCLQDHNSQADWTPDTAVSLWVSISDPAEEWPVWSQPVGAHDAYAQGAKVSHKEHHWTSDVDANVWEPGVYGWTQADE